MKSVIPLFFGLASAVAIPASVEKRATIYSGTPMGFAAGTTGGGNAATVTPKTTADLIKYLTSSDPQNIVISGEFKFAGTEGNFATTACEPYSCSIANGGQGMLNTLNGCKSGVYNVNIDKAAYQGIAVKSNKTLVGKNGATLNGKGLRIVNAKNIIVQNIKITNLNPKYVWGGDAISISDSSNVWIDHVTTSSLGRQHYSFGTGASTALTISNSFIDGKTAQSSTCNGKTYWGFEMVGSGDQITLYKNYIANTSGRSPALSGKTVLHAVNNVWESNPGHAIEGGEATAIGLFEGNYFKNVPTVYGDYKGKISSAGTASACQSALGRSCVANAFSGSGTFSKNDNVYSSFKGKAVTPDSASSIQSTVPKSAGNTL